MTIQDLELPHVGVKMKALRRFWSGCTGIYVFVSVKGRSIDDTTLSELAEAASAQTPDAQRVWVRGWIPVEGGWHGQQTSRGGQGWAMRQRWFEAFASELDLVLTGEERATVTSGPLSQPKVVSDEWELATNVAYTQVDTDRTDAHMFWLPSRETTVELCDAAEAWAAMPGVSGTTTYLRRVGGVVPVKVDPVAPLMVEAMENCEGTHLSVERSRPASARLRLDVRFALTSSGLFRVLSDRHSTDSWPVVRDKLVEALTLVPAHTDYGYIRYANHGADGWWAAATRRFYWASQVPRGGRRLSPTDMMEVQQNDFTSYPVLFGHYVPDVNGIQLVTETHLEKARDLSGWDLEPLAGGRYLLLARDLDAWYGRLEPDPEVVARAQRDFGDMVLTLEAMAAADLDTVAIANVERRIHLKKHSEDATEFEQRSYGLGFFAQH